MSKCGKFQCLKDILDVLEFNIFFEVVVGHDNVRNQHTSFNSLKLIAENVSTKSEALQLVCVVVDWLKFHLNSKRKSILEKMIHEISYGFEGNMCFDQDDMFEFIYELLYDGVGNSGFALEVLYKKIG